MHHWKADESIQCGLRCASGLWATRIHLVLTPPPHAPPHFFTLFAIHANRGSRGGTLYVRAGTVWGPAATSTSECRDLWML